VEYWASSPTASWASQGHGDFDGTEFAFMKATESCDRYSDTFYWASMDADEAPFEQSSWSTAEVCCAWVDPNATTISDLVWFDYGVLDLPSDLRGLRESDGLSTPDEYFWGASSLWTGLAVWQTTPEIWECDDGVFNIPARLTGLVECDGLATPEEFFFAAAAV